MRTNSLLRKLKRARAALRRIKPCDHFAAWPNCRSCVAEAKVRNLARRLS